MDLGRLSPADFEDLVGDLVRAEFGVRVEHFGAGPDGGIDLRADGQRIIVQCKHYQKSTWKQLLRALTNEVEKVRALAPDRYLVATTQSLSPKNKDAVAALFPGYVHSAEDIWGAEQIQAHLRAHPEVVGQHPRLWMESRAILDRLLHADAFTRTDWTLEDARADAQRFVRPTSWFKAIERLRTHHVCILAGPPGIGKTTLARMLLLDRVRQGDIPEAASGSVSELLGVMGRREPHILIFDDFLGQSDISDRTLLRNEDGDLIRLIRTIKGTPHRLLLTTREYILKDALQVYERLERAEREGLLTPLVLDASRFTRLDKARILLNHVWHTQRGQAHVRALLADRAWKQIVDHRNYNPRIVRVTIEAAEAGRTTKPLVDALVESLQNPHIVWDAMWRRHLDEAERCVLRAALSLPRIFQQEVLREAWEAMCAAHDCAAGTTRFREALDLLHGLFLQDFPNEDGSGMLLRFANPSVGDFLRALLMDDPGERIRWIRAARYIEQLISIATYRRAFLRRGPVTLDRSGPYAREAEVKELFPATELDALLEAAGRMLHKSAQLISIFGKPGVYLRRNSGPEAHLYNLGIHLDLDLRFSAASPTGRWLIHQVERLLDDTKWANPRLARVACLAPLRERILRQAVDAVEWFHHLEGFEFFDVDALPGDVFSTLEEKYHELAHTEREWALEQADSLDEAEAALNQIESLADHLGLISPLEHDDFDAVRETHEHDYQDDGDDWRHESRESEADGDDGDIDALFERCLET